MTFMTTKSVNETFVPASWQHMVYSEFEAALMSKSRPFPCVFGVSGLKAGHIRVAFLDPLEPETLAPVLLDYQQQARSFGTMTSLVVFSRPGPVRHMDSYRDKFWSLLDSLEQIDPSPRPADIPRRLEDANWEFCFGGEPTFVVCNSPAHIWRQSRRSTSFMITFQPRWVFDGITNSDDPAILRSLKMVRERLHNYDAVSTYPYLGNYGDDDNREYEQYFIADDNEKPVCPFHQLSRNDDDEKEGKVA